jgi:preprotein translocase subunit SecG
MSEFLTTLHVMVCISLVAVVLLQRGKGADIGAALGGGSSNTVFGGRGAGNFLTKLTTGCAIVFMLTSLSLSYLGSQESDLLFGADEPFAEESASSLLEETETEPTAESDTLVEIVPGVIEATEDTPEAP